MARFRKTDVTQTQLIPVSYESQILPGSFEDGMMQVLERIDLSILNDRFKNDETGRPAYRPEILLRIILLAYSRGIYSSRKMEQACRENVLFMAIAESETPDFTTISDFISGMQDEIQNIFERVILVCHEADLIGGEVFAMDGCKIRSNASKEWSGTIKDLERKKTKTKAVVGDLIKKHRKSDSNDERVKLKNRIEKNNRLIEKLAEYLDKAEPRLGRHGREKTGNITDPESAKMISMHGMIQGYNGIALVDGKHQVILSTEAFGLNQEHETLQPVLEQAERIRRLKKKPLWPGRGIRFLADTGYFSESNLKYLYAKRYDDYIPDHNFRRRDPRFKTRMGEKQRPERFIKSDFRFDFRQNRYICPAGKILKQKGGLVDYRGGKAKIYQSQQADCTACKIRDACITKKAKRKLIWFPLHNGENHSERMRTKIDSPKGRAMYIDRMHIVEPVFGNITFHKRLNYFTLRGKRKVNVQWKLYCMVHNIEKIAKYGKK